ncbi:MAG: phosphate uptake regulator PhoU, partial [Candidatus Bathyarchaeia archaeon]
MEKRRIQLVGRSTLTVSLPASWAKKVEAKKGDFVMILQEKDGSLRIMHDAIRWRPEADVYVINADLCQGKGLIERLIIAGYVKGYDKIRVVSSNRINKETLREISEAEIKLIGLSVVEEESSNVTLQCSINPADFQLDIVLRRLYTLFSTMLDESIEALMNSNLDLAEEVEGRGLQANRTYSLILRLLNQAQKNPRIFPQADATARDVLNVSIVANAF